MRAAANGAGAAARLTAALLAPKGAALPLREAYATPYLDPIATPGRGHPPAREGAAKPARAWPGADAGERERVRVACRLEADEYRRLRILAARRRQPLGVLLREALAAFLAADVEDCPCLGGGAERDGAGGERSSACCGPPR